MTHTPSDFDISTLQIHDESVVLIVRRQTHDAREVALSYYLSSHSVAVQPCLARRVFFEHCDSLILVAPEAASGATKLCAFSTGYDPAVYLHMAVTAKDRDIAPFEVDADA